MRIEILANLNLTTFYLKRKNSKNSEQLLKHIYPIQYDMEERIAIM